MILLAWPLVFLGVGRFFGQVVLLLALFCPFFFPSLWFLFVYPCVLLGALFPSIQYAAFIDIKKKKQEPNRPLRSMQSTRAYFNNA